MKHLIKNNQILKSGIPGHFTRENGEAFWGGYDERTDLHYEDGWRDEIIPEHDPIIQTLGEPYYDQDLDAVTYPILEIADLPDLAQAKISRIREVKLQQRNLLVETDGYIIRRAETGKSVPQTILNERQAIRVKAEQLEAAINALQTTQDVLKFEINF